MFKGVLGGSRRNFAMKIIFLYRKKNPLSNRYMTIVNRVKTNLKMAHII